jgi:hypothetical protein
LKRNTILYNGQQAPDVGNSYPLIFQAKSASETLIVVCVQKIASKCGLDDLELFLNQKAPHQITLLNRRQNILKNISQLFMMNVPKS